MVRQGHSRQGTRSRAGSTRASSPVKPRTEAEIYNELLDETVSSRPVEHDGRPLKRRRIGSTLVEHQKDTAISDSLNNGNRQIQTIDESESSEYEESDIDFEDALAVPEPETAKHPEPSDISLVLNEDDSAKKEARIRSSRRLPASAADKLKRLNIHKIHFCCLLTHCFLRNAWCNDETLQSHLRPLLSKRIISWLDPDKTLSQSGRSTNFTNGLQQARDMWRVTFDIAETGLRRPMWTSSASAGKGQATEDETTPLTRKDFVKLGKTRKGSRDVGAQLFCAMLRSAGVDARLVCSLQVLPFNAAPAASPRETPIKKTVYHSALAASSPRQSPSEDETPEGPRPIKRFGHSSKGHAGRDIGVAPSPKVSKRKRIRDSPYPVFWVEAYNEAVQKWVAVDPLVTQTIGKPARLEPPASDELNNMAYVIAFEDDSTATDVTRRYAKAYNAKTRKNRVESSKDGERWLRKALRLYKRRFSTDQAQIERAELANKEAAEPMPRNVQDFKNHPYYAMERHLRSHEMIHPKRQVGKVGVGKGGEVTEAIYRRSDVQQLKTADKWYRFGKEIKEGEQPLKFHVSRRKGTQVAFSDDEDEEDQGVGLYAEFQTEPYIPPSVIRGRIPKNHFGNLDIYVPTMIPAGAAHIRASEAAFAARLLGIDYADAVVGFQFKGRRGTAVTRGAVVALEYLEAIEEVVKGLRWQKEREANAKREAQILRLWKRFLIGLRIRDRIAREHGADLDKGFKEELDDEEDQNDERAARGGFVPDTAVGSAQGRNTNEHSPSMVVRDGPPVDNINDLDRPIARLGLSDYLEPSVLSPWDKVMAESSKATGEEPMPDAPADEGLFTEEQGAGGFLPDPDVEAEGGGFVREDIDYTANGGGFMLDDEPNPEQGSLSTHKPEPEADAMNLDDDETKELSNTIETSNDSAGGFVVEDEVASTSIQDATDIQSNVNAKPDVPPENTVETDEKNNGPGKEDTGVVEVHDESKQDEHPQEHEAESLSDASMLSHDPEDEDAEPDWLADM